MGVEVAQQQQLQQHVFGIDDISGMRQQTDHEEKGQAFQLHGEHLVVMAEDESVS